MKRLILFMLLVIPLAASAQWIGSISVPVGTDTVIWADKYRPNAPWSLDTKYDNFNGTAEFGIVVSNWDDGSWNYYPVNGITFPVILNPVVDSYTGLDGTSKATRPYHNPYIIFKKFGIYFKKVTVTSGTFSWDFKQ